MKALIDKLEAYTYNKSTVWFLSTPIQIIRTMCGPPFMRWLFFFVLVAVVDDNLWNFILLSKEAGF